MSDGGWQRAFVIFEKAVELAPGERDAFLDNACGDPEVRRAVEGLLAADEQPEALIDRPWLEHPWGAGTAPESAAEPRAMPRSIGPYRLLRRIGQGGMSTVYLAARADDSFRRQMVVKVVRQDMECEEILSRLRTERQILAGLEHPYVARLYDGGSTDRGLPYFVMEYVEGEPVDAYCEHNRLTIAQRLTLFQKVCAAVQYAHQNLVVHRDIKPSNILVTPDGNPKLLDFGIAKMLKAHLTAEEAEPTVAWQRAMTPSYASPEQIRGRPVTTGSDIYSLGVLLYKLLTGRLPRSFEGHSPKEIEDLVLETEPEPPSAAVRTIRGPESGEAVQRQLRGDLDAIVLKALRGTPRERYSSVERFAADLEQHQQGRPVAARAPTWTYRAGKFLRRHRAGVAAAVAIAMLLIGFVAAMIWQSARVTRERDQARLERDKKEEVLALMLDVFELGHPYVLPGETLSVREALARGVPVLEDGLREQPDVRAELLHASGSILTAIGEFQAAEKQLEEALEIRRRLDGESHGDTLRSLSALAAVRKELGKLEEAETLARRSVELARSHYGPSHPLLVEASNELVSVLCYRSDYEAAESLARDALTLARELPRGVDQEILSLEYLALIRSARGDDAGAAELYREALEKRRTHYGEKHPIQINTLSNLGLTLRRQEEFAAAEKMYRELLELQRESYGDDHRDPITLGNLAGLRFAREDFEGARELYREALDAVVETRGENHWTIFVFAAGIERSRLREGTSPREVEASLRRLIEHWLPTFGDDHWRLAEVRSLLGESVSLQGRCEEAEFLLDAAYQNLVRGARQRQKQAAFERLEDHFARCGQPQKIRRYEATG